MAAADCWGLLGSKLSADANNEIDSSLSSSFVTF